LAQPGAEKTLLEGYSASVAFTLACKCLVLSRDNRTLIKVIALAVDDLLQIVQSRLIRNLTTKECQQYLHVNVCPSKP
jgi:hypothetical protein